MAVRVEQVGHHVLSFRAEDLPTGLGECLACGARMDVEAWLIERCPGKPKEGAA